MIVKWSDVASAELEAALTYLQNYAPDVDRGFVERVLFAERSLITFPRAGLYNTASNTYDHYVPRTRIILTYRVHDDFIEVLRVWHTSRDPETKST